MIELTKNMRQKDDQPFTELLNRFRTASQTEGDIQCIQSRLVHPEDTDYPVSIALYFWDSFFFVSPVYFHIPKLFFLQLYFFLCWLHCFVVLFFFLLCLIINFFLSFLSNTLHEEYYISLVIFLMASTSEAIPFMFLVY